MTGKTMRANLLWKAYIHKQSASAIENSEMQRISKGGHERKLFSRAPNLKAIGIENICSTCRANIDEFENEKESATRKKQPLGGRVRDDHAKQSMCAGGAVGTCKCRAERGTSELC